MFSNVELATNDTTISTTIPTTIPTAGISRVSAGVSASASAGASAVEKPNNFRIATESEIIKHNDAFKFLCTIKDIGIITNSEYMDHFKSTLNPNTLAKQDKMIQHMILQLRLLEQELNKAPKSRSKLFKKNYNTTLNNFWGIVYGGSILQNLLPINDNYVFLSKRVPTIRERVDFCSGFEEKISKNSGKFILHTKGPKQMGGGRTKFETPEDCLSAMRGCLDVPMTCDSLSWSLKRPEQDCQEFIKIKIEESTYCASLKINFRGTEFWVDSNSSKLKHILCGGSFNPKCKKLHYSDPVFVRLYPAYSEFLQLVENKIKQIIVDSHSNPDCDYTAIDCCRITPACSHRNFCHKLDRYYTSKRVVCEECQMDLCRAGCGRVYHGETPCENSLDEATETQINSTSKACPGRGCNSRISKIEGCNHMTCSRCKTEFCWVCGEELPRDERGHYSTERHFNPGAFGIGRAGGCNQFNGVH